MDLRLIFLIFAVVMLVAGRHLAMKYESQLYGSYRVLTLGRMIVSVVFLLSLTFLIVTVFGMYGFILSGIVLLIAGVIWHFDSPSDRIN